MFNPPTDRTTELQKKLNQAARRDPKRRFHALYDRLYLPYVLRSAWELVKRNRGAAGVDQQTLEDIEAQGVEEFLAEVAQALREKTYRPQPVRRVLIPKGDGRMRPLGIPTVRDRVVQAAAKLILEPIFEADFEGTPSFGFRPGIGAHEALAVVQESATRGYRWVVDADIECFFDRLDHQRLMEAVRRRVSDGEVLRLIWRWLKAGFLEGEVYHDTDQGSPQGGVLSPLLANVYLWAFDQGMQSQKSFVGRLVRYADDFVIQCGTEAHAKRALVWARETLQSLGLTLHPEKTRVVEDREGFDFLGFHHHRVLWKGRQAVKVRLVRWPSRKACQRFRARVRQLVGPPARLRANWNECMKSLRRFLVGWGQYYRHGQSRQVFLKLDWWLTERVARHCVRAIPTRQRRGRRHWQQYAVKLRAWGQLPRLLNLRHGDFPAYCGQANVRWRAG